MMGASGAHGDPAMPTRLPRTTPPARIGAAERRMIADRVIGRGILPDPLLRAAITQSCRLRLRRERVLQQRRGHGTAADVGGANRDDGSRRQHTRRERTCFPAKGKTRFTRRVNAFRNRQKLRASSSPRAPGADERRAVGGGPFRKGR